MVLFATGLLLLAGVLAYRLRRPRVSSTQPRISHGRRASLDALGVGHPEDLEALHGDFPQGSWAKRYTTWE